MESGDIKNKIAIITCGSNKKQYDCEARIMY